MVRIYEFKREKRINEISQLLKGMLEEGESKPRKEIITAISAKYGVSRKTAGDYFEAAKFNNEHI